MSGRGMLRRADGGANGEFDYVRTLQRLGNSRAATIPADVLDEHDIQIGDEVGIEEVDNGVKIVFPE